jgi:diketogulonate reductase-like aldo/keto reductase
MPDRTLSIDGVRVPRFLYGTAWKEDQTQPLTALALRQGFRGLDTANQRRHYDEAAVGRAIAAAVAGGLFTRDDLFLQTKFTFRRGQDGRLPYDPKAPVPVQVEQSFASSLKHLGTAVIDSYLLHGPSRREGLAPDDWEAWRAMEALHDRGQACLLGVSNVSLEQLQLLCDQAGVRPRFVWVSRKWSFLSWPSGRARISLPFFATRSFWIRGREKVSCAKASSYSHAAGLLSSPTQTRREMAA